MPRKRLSMRKYLNEPGSSIDFLGFTFRFDRSLHGPGRYLNIVPSAKSLKRARSRIHDMTIRRIQQPVQEVIGTVNRFLVGWSHRHCRHLDGPSLYRALESEGLVYLYKRAVNSL